MSSHHRAAGTAKWSTPSAGVLERTVANLEHHRLRAVGTGSVDPRVRVQARWYPQGVPDAVGEVARRSPTVTSKGVGIAENGAAIQIDERPGLEDEHVRVREPVE